MTDSDLTPTRLQQVKALFESALDRPPSEREAFLALATATDPALRAEVASLLGALGRAGDTLAPAISGDLVRVVAGEDDRYTGTRVGAYELIARIGIGGMGTVYEGIRADDHFRKRVAVKFLRRSVESDLAIRRFRYERQILANLNHRNIAGLLDGGVTPDGQPYFVMEYVAGEPITQWCDGRTLGIRERVALFRQVCGAVQHAHQNLVVHRDLKPGNILVTDDGTVKLLDFGIAKLLRDEEGLGQLPPTQGGMRAFTPDYASPEQVRGLPVGTTSDVYALGVVLYELLTGRRPFRLDGKLLGEIEQIICNEVARRPSAAVAEGFAAKTGERSTRRVAARLEGDLDAIVLTALRKEPDRRYGSADQLAIDLRRHLDGLPVSARRDGWSYRFGKLVRRRRVEFAAGALTVLSLVGGIVATRRQAARAETETARATAINSFLTTMLGGADPNSMSKAVTVRQLLDSATVRADSLRGQPRLEAEIRGVIGRTYLGLGEYAIGQRELARSMAIHQQLDPGGSVATAVAMSDLVMATEGMGEFTTADSLSRVSYAMIDRFGSKDDLERAVILDDLARLRQKLGDLAGSEKMHRRALAFRTAHPADASGMIFTLNNLAVVLTQLGRAGEAESIQVEAVRRAKALYGPEHPVVAATLAQYATVLDIAGKTAAADSVFRLTLDMRRKLLGPEHPEYAWTLFNYAQFLIGQHRWAEAATEAREVLTLRGRTLPDTHPAVATAMQALGIALDHQDSLDAGGRWIQASLDLRRKNLPAGHWLIVSGEGVLGEHLARQHQWAQAETVLLKCEHFMVENRGDKSPQVQDARQRLVDLYTGWHKPAEAARWRALMGARPAA